MSQLRLTRVMRAQIGAIRDVLTPWGLGTALVNEGPHLVVKVFARDGGAHRLTISCTPKDRDAAINKARQNAKRLLNHLNARAGF